MTRILRQPSACALLLALSFGGLAARDLAADAPAGDVTVPDFVGLDLDVARRLSQAAGVQCQPVYGAPGTAGRVVSQDPGGLAVRPAGTPIRITVAGPDPGTSREPAPAPEAPPTPEPVAPTPPPTPPTRPPDGPPAGEGPSPLETTPPAPTLPPPETPPAEAPTPPPQNPPEASGPGAPAAPTPGGVDIDALTVEPLPSTQGPAVPVVLGHAVESARQALARWQVTVELILADAASNGRVVEQYPRPTSNLAEGEQVTLIVGTTAAPAGSGQVPKLVGTSVDEAVAALKKAGFQPALRATPSTGAERGQVLRQSPQRYSFAARGSEVRVTVGRGDLGGASPAPATPRAPAPPEGPPAGEAPAPPAEVPAPEEPAPAPPSPPKAAPGPTTLVGPADGENYPRAHGATFEWRTVPNADGYQWELEIQAGTAWRAAQAEKLIGTKFRPARLEAGRYRWRVRALIGETPGAWTDFRLLYLY